MFAWQGLPGPLLLLLLLLVLIRQISILPVAGASPGGGSTVSPGRAGIPLRVVEGVGVAPLPALPGEGSCAGDSPGVSRAAGMVTWPKAGTGSACPGWMLLILEQSTDDADGGHSQSPGTPRWP